MNISKLITDNNGRLNVFPFPPNEASDMPENFRRKLVRFIVQKYAWPLVMARRAYEDKWDKMLAMSKAQNNTSVKHRATSKVTSVRNLNIAKQESMESEMLSSTVIADSVNRLSALSYFICFKESMPGRFGKPVHFRDEVSTPHYTPVDDKIEAWNAWLAYNAEVANLRLGWMKSSASRYTYGQSFVLSEFKFQIGKDFEWQNGQVGETKVLKRIGVSYEPMSIRRFWANPEIPIDSLHLNPCVFYYSMVNRADLTANAYNAETNPFGYTNLKPKTVIDNNHEMETAYKAMRSAIETSYGSNISFRVLSNIFKAELLWTFHCILPIARNKPNENSSEKDLQNLQKDEDGGWILDEDGSKGVPTSRFIVSLFGGNLISGDVDIVKFQRNFFPDELGPVYGSAIHPDTESGLYSSSPVSICEGAYDQLCKTLQQWLTNKELLNDPPSAVNVSSPAMHKKYDFGLPSAKIPVNSPNDVTRLNIIDGSQAVPQVMDYLTDSIKTTTKTTDALLGKAMGARTSATEANNVFTTAMSSVTADIDGAVGGLFEPYARRVVRYSRWLDPDLLKAVTGYYSIGISPDSHELQMAIPCNAGTRFIESLTLQSNLRYVLESSRGETGLNRPLLWTEILKAFGMRNISRLVLDNGMDHQVKLATTQAEKTYLGELIIPDPAQDHQIAIEVKLAFLKDKDSHWNQRPDARIAMGELVRQIGIHQSHLQILQMQQNLQPQPTATPA